jgi:cellulose synthase/poly-beta-1,6-N-acetylglucosamine synthase-like glycosyltransferase
MARCRPRPTKNGTIRSWPVSIVVAAHNEARQIGRRVFELAQMAAAVHPQSEVIVVSDGSTDSTAETVRSAGYANVRVIELAVNLGKAQALNSGVAAARHEVVAFADARQTWGADTLTRLLDRFADQEIGAVSGDLELRNENGTLAGVDFYWRLEKMLRVNESRWHSSIGVTGAVCAARRSLIPVLPQGTVLDDVYWPMAIVLRGWRVVHEPRAAAYDRLPDDISGEYHRKLRTLAGNFQLLARMPSLLVPSRNPVWFQFLSHKVLRLATPWLLLMAWGVSLALARNGIYAGLWATQSLLFAVGLFAWKLPSIRRVRAFGILAAVFALNWAAFAAFWIWLRGGESLAWKKVTYSMPNATATQ